MRNEWWIDKVGYQIYPRSFADSNGDGIGDLPGIIGKLDHLADLGIGFIWLSPIYRSPMADNGYDISDYRDIAPEFGTLADMDRLIEAARARDIEIVMDLVVNHTSDRHQWFQAAKGDRSSPYRDYYIWREPGADGGPPDARRSYFGGPAWRRDQASGQYYLALFTPEQPDLNWANAALREEIWDMMQWWLDRGVAGFRMDVIDHIGKDIDRGIITDGPELHAYLREMHDRVIAGRDILTVGEAWSATTETAPLYTGRDRHELHMMFQFAHITEHWDEVHGKWKPKPLHLPGLKRVLDAWQDALADDGWNALFWNNHDLPRAVSAYGDEGAYRARSSKALATALHLMKGTPFVYQGEEIGMTNARFAHIGQFRDVETLNHYAEAMASGIPEVEFIAGANANGRDTGRTPMHWDAGPHAGFTTGTPWIAVAPNHGEVNVAHDRGSPDGVFDYYRRLIALRRAHPVIVHGRYTPYLQDHPQVMAYARSHEGTRLGVLVNLSGETVDLDVPAPMRGPGEILICNLAPREELARHLTLQPWEAVAVASRGA